MERKDFALDKVVPVIANTDAPKGNASEGGLADLLKGTDALLE